MGSNQVPTRRRRARRARRGFTLIELLVVVVIIGILATVALPAFVSAQDRARNSAVQSNVKSIQIALAQYSAEYNGAFPEVDYVKAKSGGGGGNGNSSSGSSGSSGRGNGGGNEKKGRGTGAPLDGLEDFMPNGEMPRSPWAKQSQTLFYEPKDGLVDARAVSDGEELMTPVGRKLGAGKVGNPPSGLNNYGAIGYDYHPDSQVYVVYGIGKKEKNAMVAGNCSNNGN